MFSFRIIIALAVLLTVGIIAGFGCSDDDNGGTGPVIPPGPSNPLPARGAVNVPVVSSFSWTCPDTLAGNLHFDLYLGTSNPPPMYRAHLADTFAVVGPLDMNKVYYWKVVAYDLVGDSASSETWTFSSASSFEFPTAVGNRWDYRYSYNVTYIDSSNANTADTVTGGSIVEISGIDTLQDSLATVHFNTLWTRGSGEGEVNQYRLIRDDGMYMFAYDNPWAGPPKIMAPKGIYYQYKGMRFGSIEELVSRMRVESLRPQKGLIPDLIYEIPPIKELAYPLETGNRWIYRDIDLGHVWNMEKDVIDLETVTVPCGSFECYAIHWLWDTDNDGEWDTDIDGYDYVSGAGTVKRVFYFYGIYITDYEGSLLGIANITETSDLEGYELHAPPTE